MSGLTNANATPLRRALAGVGCGAAGILSALGFVVGQAGYIGMSELPASSTSYLWGALALCFMLLYWHVYARRALRPGALCWALGLLFGVLNAFAGVLFAYDSWSMSATALLGTLARALLQALPMVAFITWADAALRGGALRSGATTDAEADAACARPSVARALESWQPKRLGGLLRVYRAHPVASVMLLLTLCWLPYLVCFYPGTVCWDLGEMAAQFFGVYEVDTWHPVLTTWLFGGCIWLGRLVGGDNLGAFLFMLLQTLALSYALSRAMLLLRSMRLCRAYRLCALAFFALSPIWGAYAQFISNDTLYTSALLLFALDVTETLLCRARDEAPSRQTLLGLFAWGLLASLLRNNGIYVVLPTALALALFGARGKARLRLGGALAGAVAGALLFTGALLPALGVKDETASGIYSVCFQQSARTLRDHADEVTQTEYAAIDRVLDAQNLPELYEPWISDPVKYTFRLYGTGAANEKVELARYRETWLSMLKKYPLTYAEAFFAGNLSYYTFMPKLEGETYNNQAGNRFVFETYELADSRGDDPRFVDTAQLGALSGARSLLAAFARGWRHIPLFGLLLCCASYVWTIVAAGASVARQRRWRMLVAFLPALLTLGVCVMSPVNDYFRYILPLVAMSTALVGLAGAKEGERA